MRDEGNTPVLQAVFMTSQERSVTAFATRILPKGREEEEEAEEALRMMEREMLGEEEQHEDALFF
jgi:hypothetical protein